MVSVLELQLLITARIYFKPASCHIVDVIYHFLAPLPVAQCSKPVEHRMLPSARRRRLFEKRCGSAEHASQWRHVSGGLFSLERTLATSCSQAARSRHWKWKDGQEEVIGVCFGHS